MKQSSLPSAAEFTALTWHRWAKEVANNHREKKKPIWTGML
jgi:hypothetical protein